VVVSVGTGALSYHLEVGKGREAVYSPSSLPLVATGALVA
jgi:hypothetical protein